MSPGCTSGTTVAAGFVRGLLDFAASKGAGRDALAEQAGLDPSSLEDQDARIKVDRYVALMHAAKEATGDPALALHYGEAVDIADLSVLGLLGQACGTAMEAFDEMNRFTRLAIDADPPGGVRFEMARRDDGFWLVDRRPDPNAFPELTESGFARMAGSARRLGIERPFREVHFTHEEPAWRSEYDRIFQAPVVFQSEWNAVRMDESLMSMTLGPQPLYLQGLLSGHAEELLEALDGSATLAGRVETLLAPLLPGGRAGIETIARAMGLSRQTLYRRLKAEGATFEQVLDGLRRRLALRYLGPEGKSVGEASWLLGFSDRAAFSRAFKRWTGSSPGAARLASPQQ
jgi:AraC-like DNA-binding protein